jgi:hypothetical protein
MIEKTELEELKERLRNGAGLIVDDVGGVQINLVLLDEAVEAIEYFEFELKCVTDERDAARAEVSHLTQERDAAKANVECANDRIKMLQNEVRW